LKLRSAEPRILQAFSRRDLALETRAAAGDALAAIDPARHVRTLGAVLRDGTERFELRIRALQALRRIESAAAAAELVAALRLAPARLQVRLAANLASREDWMRSLLDAVEAGKASRHLLMRTGVATRIKSMPADVRDRAAKLTAGLAPEEEAIERLIERRRAEFRTDATSAQDGARVFEKYCTKCHQIGGKGKTVGPQLDAIGHRGLDRLIEDVLDPSRNVELAFRSSMIKLRSGGTTTGIVVKEEPAALLVVDEQGEQIRIAKADIASRVESRLSPMPSDFADQIPPDDFNRLIAFLVAARAREQHP
jgi:putative heme-binding domain-containing protein